MPEARASTVVTPNVTAGVGDPEQDGGERRSGEGPDGVDQPARHRRTRQFERRLAQRRHERGVGRAIDDERRAGDDDEDVQHEARAVERQRQRACSQRGSAQPARPAQHSLAGEAIGQRRGDRQQGGGDDHPHGRDETDGDGAPVAERDDADRDGERPLRRPRRAERDERVPKVRAPRVDAERPGGLPQPGATRPDTAGVWPVVTPTADDPAPSGPADHRLPVGPERRPQLALEDLAGAGLGQRLVAQLDAAWAPCSRRSTLGSGRTSSPRSSDRVVARHDDGVDRLTPPRRRARRTRPPRAPPGAGRARPRPRCCTRSRRR